METDYGLIRATLDNYGYTLLEPVGQGGFSRCYKVLDRKYQTYFIDKVTYIEDSRPVEKYFNEIEILKKIVHPNIVAIYNYFFDNSYVHLIIEYCPNGTIQEYMKKNKLNISQKLNILKQILNALSVCHELHIAHRDIKPSNVFMDSYTRPKLGDFGISCFNPSEEKVRDFSGSLPFLAPELICMKAHDPIAADIWSFGILSYMIMFGYLPWIRHNLSVEAQIKLGDISFPKKASIEIIHFIKEILKVRPEQRMTANQLLQNTIFKASIKLTNSTNIYQTTNFSLPLVNMYSKKFITLQRSSGISNLLKQYNTQKLSETFSESSLSTTED